jgi:hypothetical protein
MLTSSGTAEREIGMKCKNCGLPKDAHIEVTGDEGERVWLCPNGSGGRFPATVDVEIQLHYRTGDPRPWVVKCESPVAGPWEFVGAHPFEVLEEAGRKIEEAMEQKTQEEVELEDAVDNRGRAASPKRAR